MIKIKKKLIQADINPLIIDNLTDFLLELKGQNFAEFTNMVDDYFWTIANDCHIITELDHAVDYYQENRENFLEIANFASIKEFWGVEHLKLADLSSVKIANYMLSKIEDNKINKAGLSSVKISNYMLSKIEENKINKINKILFDIINQ